MSAAPNSSRPLSPARKAWRFACLLVRPALARKLGTLVTEGYLAQTGWVRSVLTDEVVDADGGPLPWMTRPFLDFIAPRLQPEWRVFEYGSGASTRFFARRMREVMAVEHDPAFAARLQPDLPENARVIVRPAGSADYINAIANMSAPPQLVSVDGMERPACAAAAVPRMAEDAVLVFDDSQLPEYAPVYSAMKTAGFRSLDFWGLAATRVEHRCTTVFYRRNNVLDI
jgi:hypothetical protein